MTRDDCKALLKRLRVLRGGPADEAQAEVYVEMFSAASREDLERGVARALKSRTFFPTPAELFSDCEQAAPRDTWTADRPSMKAPTKVVYLPNPFGGEGIRIRVSEDSGYTCEECSDTGWSPVWCGEGRRQPWLRVWPCGRDGAHPGHEWVAQCACWHTNARLIAKRARTAQHARGGKAEGAA